MMTHDVVRSQRRSRYFCDSDWEICQYLNTNVYQYLMCRYIYICLMLHEVMMNEPYYGNAMNQGTFNVSENYVSFISPYPGRDP